MMLHHSSRKIAPRRRSSHKDSQQLSFFSESTVSKKTRANSIANRLEEHDRAFHDWYRFVLAFPPHLVRDYLERFQVRPDDLVLDPFCGTGTTLVEAKTHGLRTVGVEANPMAHFASTVKTDWSIRPAELVAQAQMIAERALQCIDVTPGEALRTLSPEEQALLLTDSISPLPLHKALVLRDEIDRHDDAHLVRYLRLALAKILVFDVSNLHFGPEVGVRRNKLTDAPVIERWMDAVDAMAEDLSTALADIPALVHHADARQLNNLLVPRSIGLVFTSPPYPNEKDYTRTTRLESVVLGFVRNKAELRALKQGMLRSNTRNVYKHDEDDRWVADNLEIQELAATIERRRVELNKTSGFERLYARVTRLYFGGMARHLAELRPFLRPGAQLGYVVGDQASYLQVMIRTGQLLADIAHTLGYEVIGIDLFRTRLATATKQQIREEVVLLRWPG
jgi:DNA modification methylase